MINSSYQCIKYVKIDSKCRNLYAIALGGSGDVEREASHGRLLIASVNTYRFRIGAPDDDSYFILKPYFQSIYRELRSLRPLSVSCYFLPVQWLREGYQEGYHNDAITDIRALTSARAMTTPLDTVIEGKLMWMRS